MVIILLPCAAFGFLQPFADCVREIAEQVYLGVHRGNAVHYELRHYLFPPRRKRVVADIRFHVADELLDAEVREPVYLCLAFIGVYLLLGARIDRLRCFAAKLRLHFSEDAVKPSPLLVSLYHHRHRQPLGTFQSQRLPHGRVKPS